MPPDSTLQLLRNIMTTPSPGRGWRWLRVGEIKRNGDEHNFMQHWRDILDVGTYVTPAEKHHYRRRVKEREKITRRKLMKVLDRTFAEGGYKITVRSYNLILTRLGFRLGKYAKKGKR